MTTTPISKDMTDKEMADRMGRIEDKLDRLSEDVVGLKTTLRLSRNVGEADMCRLHDTRLEAIERRTESLQRRQTQLFTGLAVLLFLLQMFTPWLRDLLKGP